jgi:DNA-binding response OmpR family regulator
MPRPRILLIDDEQQILDLLLNVLTADGYAVDAVLTVAEAIASLDRFAYELVISDWRLPDGDGLFVADTAAALGTTTILMSGHLGQMRGGREARHLCFVKPFKMPEFERL